VASFVRHRRTRAAGQRLTAWVSDAASEAKDERKVPWSVLLTRRMLAPISNSSQGLSVFGNRQNNPLLAHLQGAEVGTERKNS